MEHIWKLFEQFHLDENMRLSNSGQDQRDFADYLLSVGDGQVEDSVPNPFPSAAESRIPLRSELRSSAGSLNAFCEEIFPNVTSTILSCEQNGDKSWHDFLMERAILCPTNKDVDQINEILINSFPGEAHEYRSHDKLITE